MMKKTIALLVIACSPLVATAVEITPPNMDVGLWVTEVDQSAIIEQALSRVPESSREMVRGMMEKKMAESARTEQCITKETLANFDQEMKDTFSEQKDCELDVKESTSEKFVAELLCSEAAINIVTKVINSKRNESTLTTNIPGMGETVITSVSEWKSAECP
ncbi:MAG: DUF3617 family protein [Gammaproteobacteria bacterium]